MTSALAQCTPRTQEGAPTVTKSAAPMDLRTGSRREDEPRKKGRGASGGPLALRRFALAVDGEIGRFGQPFLDELVAGSVGDHRRQGGVHVRDEGATLLEDEPRALPRVLRELTGDREPLELLGRDVVGALQILDDGIDLAVDQRRQRIGRGVEYERVLLRLDVVGNGDVVERSY